MSSASSVVKEMEVASNTDALYEVMQAVEEVTGQVGMDEDTAEEVAIAVSEAVNNAIFHGNGGEETKIVRILFGRENNTLKISVFDQGLGFDPDAVPDPLAEENLLKPSGRGLLVMRSMMDGVEHSFTEKGTEVILSKQIPVEE